MLAAFLWVFAAQAQPLNEPPGTRNWRDALTPLQDPLRTRPPELESRLNVKLPPDLAGEDKLTPEAALDNPLDTDACAHADAANAFDNPERARAMLGGQRPAPHETPRLDLPQAVRLALCHNAGVRATWSAIAQQAAALGQAKSAYLPQVNASVYRYRSRLRYPGSLYPETDLNVNTQNIGLSWRILDFGTRNAKTDMARYQLQAALASQNAAIQNALRDVAQTYFDAQVAWARRQAQDELHPLAERTLNAARRRQSHGTGSGNDALQAESAVARIELERSRAQGDYRKAMAMLTQTLGLPMRAVYRLAPLATPIESGAETRAEQRAFMHKALDDWLAEAAARHPTILVAKAQWQAAQAGVRAAQSEGLPTFDLGYNFYRNGRPNTALNAMQSRESVLSFSLNLPLFDGFNTTYKVRGAKALAEQKGIEYQAAEQQVIREVVQTHAEAQAALDNLDAAQRLYLAARAVSQSTQRQYAGGAADVVQVNQSLSALQQSLAERIRAEADWLAARMKLWTLEAAMESSAHQE